MRKNLILSGIILASFIFFLPFTQAEPVRAVDIPLILKKAKDNVGALRPSLQYRIRSNIAVLHAKVGEKKVAKHISQDLTKVAFSAPIEGARSSSGGSGFLSFLLDLAVLQNQAGFEGESLELITRIIQSARGISDPTMKFFTYQDIVVSQVKLKQLQAVQQSLKLIFEQAEKIQGGKYLALDDLKIRTFLRISQTYLEMKNDTAALFYLNHASEILENKQYDPAVDFWPFRDLEAIGHLHAKLGNVRKAKDTLALLPEIRPWGKINAYINAAHYFLNDGKHGEATLFIKKALGIVCAQQVANDHWIAKSSKWPALRRIADVFALTADIKNAREVNAMVPGPHNEIQEELHFKKLALLGTRHYLQALEIVKKETEVDYHALYSIINGLVGTSELTEALEAFKFLEKSMKIKFPDRKQDGGFTVTEQDPTIHQIIKTLGALFGEKMKSTQALSWAQHHKLPDERAYALLGLAEGLLNREARPCLHQ